jgi:hypothetical protein
MNEQKTYYVRYDGPKGSLNLTTLQELAKANLYFKEMVDYVNMPLDYDLGVFVYQGSDLEADLKKITLDEKIKIIERERTHSIACPGSSGPACPPSPQS